MYRFSLAISFGLALVLNFGCAPPGKPNLAPSASVKGTVNIDGKPIPNGEIHFVMGGVPPGVMTITDGAYSEKAPIGDNKVEVYIYVDGPPNPKYPDATPKKNTTPERYWGPNTSLAAKVTEGGANEFKFDITSK